jgi:pentatricopeptide repeat protein
VLIIIYQHLSEVNVSVSAIGSQVPVNRSQDVVGLLSTPSFYRLIDDLKTYRVHLNSYKLISDQHQERIDLKLRQISSQVWGEGDNSNHELNETIARCTALRDEVLRKYDNFRKRPNVPFCRLDAEASKFEERRDLLNNLLVRLANVQDELSHEMTTYQKPIEEIADHYKLLYNQMNQLLSDLIKIAAIMPDINSRDEVLFTIARVRLDLGEIGEYCEITSRIENPERKDAALSHLSSHYVNAGNLEKAHEVAKTIGDSGDRFLAMERVLGAHSALGEFREAFICALSDADICVSSNLLIATVLAAVGSGNQEVAFGKIETIPGDDNQARILAAFVSVMVDQGNIERAIMAAATIQNEKVQHECFTKICKQLAEAPNLELSLEIIQNIPTDKFRDQAYFEIVLAFVTNMDMARAKEIALLIKKVEIRDEALFGIATHSAGVDFISAAHNACNAIESPLLRDRTSALICGAYAKRGDFDKAIELYRSMGQQKLFAFNQICAKLARPEPIRALVQIAKEMDNEDDRDRALSSCAEQMNHLEKFYEAEQIAQCIKSENLRNQILSEIPNVPTPPSSPEFD